jgi:hypothetical protein
MVIVTIGDLHTGSAFAPFPPDFTNSVGAMVALNRGQQYLLRCWRDFQARIPARFDALLLLGDLIHGKNPKESAAELCEVDPEWQQRAALELLAPIAERAKEVYAVRGSPYHVGEMARWEEQLTKQLGAIPDRMGHHARTWLHLNLRGVLLDVAHRQSVVMVNLLMPLEREMRYALMRTQAEGERPPDIVIRAHAHTYKWAEVDGMLGLSMPAWKMPSSYVMTSITPNRKRSRLLGSVMLNVRPRRKKAGGVYAGAYIDKDLIWYRTPALETVRYGAARA